VRTAEATVTRTETEDSDVPVLTVRQQRELLRGPDKRRRLGRRDACLLAIMVGTGARIGEVVRLRVQDEAKGPNGSLLLRLQTLKQRRRDGRVPLRPVAILPPFVSPVRKYLASARPGFWFFEGRRGEHPSVRAAQDAILKHLRRVRPDLRVHDLRHTAATDTLRASGGDVWITAKMLGHVDTRQVVRTYAHYLTKDALRAAEARAAALSNRRGAEAS